MRATEPLALHHSWPIMTASGRLDLGMTYDAAMVSPSSATIDKLATRGIGRWCCDLSDDRLQWSDPVYDLFALPRGSAVDRADSLRCYADESRATMERLRTYAIRHRRGFTIDVELRPAGSAPRWMRLLGAPVCIDGRVVRLEGLKQDLGRRYR